MEDLYQKTKRLWAAFFPRKTSQNTRGDEITRLTKHSPEQAMITPEIAEATMKLMTSFSDGPFPLEAFSESLSVKLEGLLSEEQLAETLQELPVLAATLNHAMFEGMAALTEAHFTERELDEALAFVGGHLWRNKDVSEELLEFNNNIERWRQERVQPLLDGYHAQLHAKSTPPTLPAIEVDDPLVMRLLEAKGIDPDAKSMLATHVQNLAQHKSTALLRKKRLWPAIEQQLLQDHFWRRCFVASYRAMWTEPELEQLIPFYESPSGKKLNTIMPKWNEANQRFMEGEFFQAKINEWLQLLMGDEAG